VQHVDGVVAVLRAVLDPVAIQRLLWVGLRELFREDSNRTEFGALLHHPARDFVFGLQNGRDVACVRQHTARVSCRTLAWREQKALAHAPSVC
jgi:hypothetical protein